ncbi:hypothetical protein AQ611_08835 [Burkholderia singularis]|nr:hypothetical protein AQ611_08835 [Burkholderia sp. Bp7605]
MDRLRAAPVAQDNIAARSSLGRGAAAAWRSSRRAKIARRQIDWLDAMKPCCRAMPDDSCVPPRRRRVKLAGTSD